MRAYPCTYNRPRWDAQGTIWRIFADTELISVPRCTSAGLKKLLGSPLSLCVTYACFTLHTAHVSHRMEMENKVFQLGMHETLNSKCFTHHRWYHGGGQSRKPSVRVLVGPPPRYSLHVLSLFQLSTVRTTHTRATCVQMKTECISKPFNR